MHFDLFFAPLCGIRRVGVHPCIAVDIITNFFKNLTGRAQYFQWRVRKYVWARRKVAGFFTNAARRRRGRLQEAVRKWEEAERQLAKSPKQMKDDNDNDPQFAAVPWAVKTAIVDSLHRTTLRDVFLEARNTVRHVRQLTADVKAVSQRVAGLWLHGNHRCPDVQQMVVRLTGLRQRVRSFPATLSLDAVWQGLGLAEFRGRLLEVKSAAANAPTDPRAVRKALHTPPSLTLERSVSSVVLRDALSKAELSPAQAGAEGAHGHVQRMRQLRGLEIRPLPRNTSFSGVMRPPRSGHSSPNAGSPPGSPLKRSPHSNSLTREFGSPSTPRQQPASPKQSAPSPAFHALHFSPVVSLCHKASRSRPASRGSPTASPKSTKAKKVAEVAETVAPTLLVSKLRDVD
eukprot:EG_transcript_13909